MQRWPSLISLHGEVIIHPLKEVVAQPQAWCTIPIKWLKLCVTFSKPKPQRIPQALLQLLGRRFSPRRSDQNNPALSRAALARCNALRGTSQKAPAAAARRANAQRQRGPAFPLAFRSRTVTLGVSFSAYCLSSKE